VNSNTTSRLQACANRSGWQGRALGLVLVFLTAFIWVAASFISQLLVTSEEGRPHYHVSPFLLTHLSTSIFTIFLPLVQLKSLLRETWLLRSDLLQLHLQPHQQFGVDGLTLAMARC